MKKQIKVEVIIEVSSDEKTFDDAVQSALRLIEGSGMGFGNNGVYEYKILSKKVVGNSEPVNQKPELTTGYVKIKGCDNATGFERICKESDLTTIAKEIYKQHPGEDGYYSFTKFLWVQFSDGREECRLDDLVGYDDW